MPPLVVTGAPLNCLGPQYFNTVLHFSTDLKQHSQSSNKIEIARVALEVCCRHSAIHQKLARQKDVGRNDRRGDRARVKGVKGVNGMKGVIVKRNDFHGLPCHWKGQQMVMTECGV